MQRLKALTQSSPSQITSMCTTRICQACEMSAMVQQQPEM